jgi:hypothetical protein
MKKTVVDVLKNPVKPESGTTFEVGAKITISK